MVFNDQDSGMYFPLSVQLSARARAELRLPEEPAQPSGAAALYYLRQLAFSLPGKGASAAHLNLLARLNAAMRCLAGQYLAARRCHFEAGGPVIDGRPLSLAGQEPALEAMVQLFPPAAVRRGRFVEDYLAGSGGRENRLRAVIELFLLGVQNANPATAGFRPLFDDEELLHRCPYHELLAELDEVLAPAAETGFFAGSLRELLAAPVKASPDSLSGQLDYVRRHWAALLPAGLLQEIASAFDVLATEEQPRGGAPGPLPVPHYGAGPGPGEDVERFSPDTDWMPRVVLIAKSIHVWLDQLSRQYGRPIHRLDQIPDAELDLLARRGFTALWLIGLWERSPASRKIKRIMGNPEAEASAYSLYDYQVADELGGEAALSELNGRCRRRGIRLGCDVVPNHTGIYSRWVREHPDWFVQLDYPPFPNYRFNGPDLSFSDDCTLQIEDGYWDHSDAAVVFRHVERSNGRVRYIYHGNDGTHMPWNDTAQLNFLLPEVREAVIRTILEVARTFKVIRFDAAMTLAKKHYQRLWFPQPGGGAGVPSRAEHWMDRDEFERCFPVEFWRDVVDRVAAEAPDTLLLAEAFWLMEEYFVRTLGMHRVYNSAFMHMLKQEENGRYHQLLRNTLEFNPEILKRFVNFMNNPDEATAVEQFGKSDKYFGVAVMLATLPGLPMFGHGQVEGFAEKYGMEYRRAYWDETVDEGFVRHHEGQIFPLLHRRYLFSEARDFELYRFESGGQVEENVFAYSNRCGGERALVVYHNRYGDAAGWVRQSVAKARPAAGGGLVPAEVTLEKALGFSGQEGVYYRFRDQCSGLQYLRSGRELAEQGMFFQLGAYDYHVFLDFEEMHDVDGRWGELCRSLNGRPAADLDLEMKKLRLASLLFAWRQVLDPDLLGPLVDRLCAPVPPGPAAALPEWPPLEERFEAFLQELVKVVDGPEPVRSLIARLGQEIEAVQLLTAPAEVEEAAGTVREWLRRELAATGGGDRRAPTFALALLACLCLHRIGDLAGEAGSPGRSADWAERYLLQPELAALLPAEGSDLVVLLVRHQDFFRETDRSAGIACLLDDPQVRDYLGVNRHAGCEWFIKERLENLVLGLCALSLVSAAASYQGEEKLPETLVASLENRASKLLAAAGQAEYRLDKWLELL
jgi:glycosidase